MSAGEMESTMLRSFIRAGKLKRWLARDDCPPAIKECKIMFDKAYAPNVSDESRVSDVGDGVFVEPILADDQAVPRKVPEDLRPLVRKEKTVMRARLRHRGVTYAISSTHLGNSLVHFYPHGDTTKSPIPGSIKYIFEHEGKMAVAIQRQLPARQGVVDPFKPYIHFPAKLYSSGISDALEIVQIDWIMCHFARWQMSSEHVVVLSLSRVCIHPFCLFVLLIK
jgi:hypothetical protein